MFWWGLFIYNVKLILTIFPFHFFQFNYLHCFNSFSRPIISLTKLQRPSNRYESCERSLIKNWKSLESSQQAFPILNCKSPGAHSSHSHLNDDNFWPYKNKRKLELKKNMNKTKHHNFVLSLLSEQSSIVAFKQFKKSCEFRKPTLFHDHRFSCVLRIFGLANCFFCWRRYLGICSPRPADCCAWEAWKDFSLISMEQSSSDSTKTCPN